MLRTLKQSSKSQGIDQAFLYTAIHELKTPLLAMKLILEMVLDPKGDALTQAQRENCTEVAKSAEQTLAMVGDILAMAKAHDENRMRSRELVNVYELLEMLRNELQSLTTQKHLTVSWEGAPTASVAILTHQESFRSILQNFFTNAIKYNRDGGTITLHIEKVEGKTAAVPPEFKAVQQMLKKHASWCVVTIADSGVGIPKEEQTKIFGRFFRASNIKAVDPYGTGLGLYLTKTLVEKLGGQVWFSSVEGKGTAFSVALPCYNCSN
ncbi:HAMP domain-containing histidine kinase [Candidatus Uhrbacteria bacterium]|nr:HAMP domain-containing histidine kinase [Candidatus Uhrbacteria bacterium]